MSVSKPQNGAMSSKMLLATVVCLHLSVVLLLCLGSFHAMVAFAFLLGLAGETASDGFGIFYLTLCFCMVAVLPALLIETIAWGLLRHLRWAWLAAIGIDVILILIGSTTVYIATLIGPVFIALGAVSLWGLMVPETRSLFKWKPAVQD